MFHKIEAGHSATPAQTEMLARDEHLALIGLVWNMNYCECAYFAAILA